ncbi:RNA polymerase sigma-70 factor [Spirosoma montaniterrae]|uniref:RNA polymerase subunit sigma-24 n=1 Tax=Spirosoma montaniterrae TaxID=1178516 RepID=A0A1P9X3P9_9BACT|nr:RNA polymerase sigma-70 factor [Spirosoma montaniterrae]AQG82262.1 hypothetical protein AWR27_02005 [Spirosoma montaniterrae]
MRIKPLQPDLDNDAARRLSKVANEPEQVWDKELFIRLAFAESAKAGCEVLFRYYYQVLCNHATRFVYSRELAEDIVSEVFCRMWRTQAYASIRTSYRFYLFRAVRNEAYNYLRLEIQGHEEISWAEISNDPIPDSVVQFDELIGLIDTILETSSPQCRRAFMLNRFEGKKYREIADEMGVSIKTVEAHVSKALHMLRKGLRSYWPS